MAFLKVGVAPSKERRLYLMRIKLPSDQTVFKLGVASGRSAKERMLQINGSIFDKYRETAMIKIVRDRKVDADNVFNLETSLHHFFCMYKHSDLYKWDGVTECFTVEQDVAIQAYEAALDGVEFPKEPYCHPDEQLPF